MSIGFSGSEVLMHLCWRVGYNEVGSLRKEFVTQRNGKRTGDSSTTAAVTESRGKTCRYVSLKRLSCSS